jgi:hypothetical protein
MYLLFNSPIPLSKELQGDLNLIAVYILNTCYMYTPNKIINFPISSTLEEHQKSSSAHVKPKYSNNTRLQFALSLKAIAQLRKVLLLKVIISSSLEPLSHP